MEREPRVTVLYSASFVVICPNCHREQMHTAGRKNSVYTCRWCEKQYTIDIAIQLKDGDGNTYGH